MYFGLLYIYMVSMKVFAIRFSVSGHEQFFFWWGGGGGVKFYTTPYSRWHVLFWTWNRNHILWQTEQWYFIKQTDHLEWPCSPSDTISIQQHLVKIGKLRNQQQSVHSHQIKWQQPGFQARIGLASYHLLCCWSSENGAPSTVLLINSNFCE